MKICVFRNQDGAIDYYRASLPVKKAVLGKMATSSEIWLSNIFYELTEETKKITGSLSSDIYLIQRFGGQKFMDRIKQFISDNKLGTKIVMDHDDDLFNVSPLSDHYHENGTEEIQIKNNGKVIYEWKDGLNIDLKLNRKRIDDVKRALERSDMVTVTTDELAKVFKPFNDNVKVLPNCVDLNEWNRLPIIRENKDEIRICWMGGASHWEDLHMIRQALKDVAAHHSNVKIVIVGYMPSGMREDFKPSQIEFHEWVQTPAHPYRLACLDIDIAIIPLRDTIFNRGKSPIKWIEMSALKIPSITSYVTPYKEVCDLDEGESGIYIEKNDTHGWIKGLELLIDSPELRKRLGEKARSVVLDHFDINTKYHLWIEAYKEVLNGNRTESRR